MKIKFKYAFLCATALLVASCGDLYDEHKQYLKKPENVYIGYADSLKANGGYERVEVMWKLNADPRISKCIISWGGSSEPVAVEVPEERSNGYMSHILPLPEGKYNFKVVVESASGDKSLEMSVSGESFGEKYKSRLPQRGIYSITASPKTTTINWMPEEGCVGVNLSYVNTTGHKKTISVDMDDTETIITDCVLGSTFSYTSMFLPEKNAIDTIQSLPSEQEFPSYYIISKTDWDATYHAQFDDILNNGWTITANSEEAGGEGAVNGYATALIDGMLNTFWHSKWQGGTTALPHIVEIDLKENKQIANVELARRENNKDTKTVEIYSSLDNEVWTYLGVLKFPNTPSPNALILGLGDVVSARYIRLKITDSNNAPHASLAEVMFTTPQ